MNGWNENSCLLVVVIMVWKHALMTKISVWQNILYTKCLAGLAKGFLMDIILDLKKHFCTLKLVSLKTILHHTEQRSICIYYKAICYSNSFLALLYKTRCCLPHLLNGFGNSNSSKLRDGNQFFCITNLLCNVFGWEKAAQHSLLQKWFRSLFIYFWKESTRKPDKYY